MEPNRPLLNLTVLQTVSNEPRVNSCGTRPIIALVLRKSLIISKPSTVTDPDEGEIMPQIVEIKVVLPAPFGPKRASISPLLISKLTALRASKPEL